MEVIEKKISELTPYENNPRRNDEAVKYVAESIKQFGFKVPLVIDKNGIIVAGHTRYKAAMELGIEEVPCIIADDLTEEQIKAFRLADNKVGEIAQWDQELLNFELDEIDIDMTDFGFIEMADLDVDGFFEDAEPKEPKPEEEKEVQCPHCGMFFKVN
jgi:site-specific DNA-methyltransferase (adenine-specific)